MEVRNSLSKVLETRFPCVSMISKVIDLENVTFFFIRLFITMKAHIVSKKLGQILKEDGILLQKNFS